MIDNDIREIINKGRLKYDKCRDLLRKAKRSNKVKFLVYNYILVFWIRIDYEVKWIRWVVKEY